MHYAIDDSTGDEVGADEVKAQGFFRCPTCLRPVTFIQPYATNYSSYFRHEHASYATECEHYQSGGGLSSRWNPTPRPELVLTTGLRPDPLQARVRLEVFFAQVVRNSNAVSVDRDLNGANRHISGSELARLGYRVGVRPAMQYLVRFTVGAVTRVATLDGLATTAPTVFSLSTGGRRLPLGESLVHGRTYLLFIPKTCPQPMGPPVRLEPVHVEEPTDWFAYSVELVGKRSQVDAWCCGYLGRTVEPPVLRVSVIHPPCIGIWPDGTVVLPEGEPIVVEITGADRTIGTWSVAMRTGTLDRARHVLIPNQALPAYASLGVLRPGPHTILVYGGSSQQRLLYLEVMKPSVPEAPAARIVGRGLDSSSQRAHQWFEPAATELLGAIRSGHAKLTRMSFPANAPVTTSIGAPVNETERNEWLTRGAAPLWLDAGPYGRLEVGVPKPTPHETLPGSLRARLRWLCLAREQQPSDTSTRSPWPSATPTEPEGLGDEDRAIVRAFLRVRSWPNGLATHVRSAWAALSPRLRT